MNLAPQQIDEFSRRYQANGFISGIRVLSLAEAAHHRTCLERAEASLGQSLHYLNKIHTVIPAAYEIATHPYLLDLVEALIGPDILLYNATFIIKEPMSAAFVSWHQDLTYWGFDGTDQVSAWVALSPANAVSGCMQMIPGSHRQGIYPHITSDDPNNILLQSQALADPDMDQGELCELKPGEVSLHHGWTVHCSLPNGTTDRRIGLNIQYIRPSMRQTQCNRDSAMLVRGSDRYQHFATDKRVTGLPMSEDALEVLKASTSQYQQIAGSVNRNSEP